MHTAAFTVTIVALTLSASAFASSPCTKEPAGKWLSQKQTQTRLEQAGFAVQRIKRSDDACYEVYATRKDGKRVELYVNPVDASVVKEEAK